jgi:hypothetical protein
VQTLVAFAFDRTPAAAEIAEAAARVETWYTPLWPEPHQTDRMVGRRTGLMLWHRADPGCRWPAWQAQGSGAAASLHAPLGAELALGSELPSPAGLVQRLRERPDDLLRLTPPFVLAAADTNEDSLLLLTDGLGLGRLYELRFPGGRVWSNRPVAALRFAGRPAVADELAWQRMAACDWPMGDATPYAGVECVPAATRIIVDPTGCRRHTLDLLPQLLGSADGGLDEQAVSEAADGLVAAARSVTNLWPDDTPVLTLSGGRDSRLVAATFLAADVDVRLRTDATISGEADTARELVARLDRKVRHQVTGGGTDKKPPATGDQGPYDRARRWHDISEGLRPAVYASNRPPKLLPHARRVLVSGVGGEFAHAPAYPEDLDQMLRLPRPRRLDAFSRSLASHFVLPHGLSAAATAAASAQIRTVLEQAADSGVDSGKAFDWFYASERLRRWGLAGESSGRVMPLLTPAFLRAAGTLSAAQSRTNALHDALIARFVPAWTGVPYFAATLRQRGAARRAKLWEEDPDRLAAVIADADDWGDAFDVRTVQAVWRRARAGRAAGRDELLLQRVLWRAAFTDHLAAVNQQAARPRTAVLPVRPARAWTPGQPLRELAVHANEIPLARKFGRTRPGRWVRRIIGV